MRAFVTGATGFIGGNLVRMLLADGYNVRTLARPHSDQQNLTGLPVEIATGDLDDRQQLAEQAWQALREGNDRFIDGLREHHIWVVPTQCLAERWITADKGPDQLRRNPEMKYMDSKTLDSWVENKQRQMSNPKYTAAGVHEFIVLRRKLIKACSEGGVGLLLGSDAPQVFNVPGFSIHHELHYLVDSGLSPYEALKTGTVNVAAFYNLSQTSG